MPPSNVTSASLKHLYVDFQAGLIAKPEGNQASEMGMRLAHALMPAVMFTEALGKPLTQCDIALLPNLQQLAQHGVARFGPGFAYAAETIREYLAHMKRCEQRPDPEPQRRVPLLQTEPGQENRPKRARDINLPDWKHFDEHRASST